MCPFCIGTAVWIAAGAVSAGGVSALAVAKSLERKAREREQEAEEPMTSNEQIANMKKPPVVSRGGMAEGLAGDAGQREGAHSRPRCAGGRPPSHALARGRERVRL